MVKKVRMERADRPGCLTFRQGFLTEDPFAAAYGALLRDVFGNAPPRFRNEHPAWVPFGYFAADGTCVAGLETAVLGLFADGAPAEATAIRLAGVAEAYRGRGLFRNLMIRALGWCSAQSAGPTLLYTEDHDLYGRFGFQPLAQHAFVGPPPRPSPVRAAKIIDLAQAEPLLDRLNATRAPISNVCAVLNASDLLRTNLRGDHDVELAYAADLDALIVHEHEEDALAIVDIVARAIPSMAQIVGALRSQASRVRTLFPPDRLAWHGVPEPDDTGLMIRGAVPAAMRRPFMLPPTTSF